MNKINISPKWTKACWDLTEGDVRNIKNGKHKKCVIFLLSFSQSLSKEQSFWTWNSLLTPKGPVRPGEVDGEAQVVVFRSLSCQREARNAPGLLCLCDRPIRCHHPQWASFSDSEGMLSHIPAHTVTPCFSSWGTPSLQRSMTRSADSLAPPPVSHYNNIW